MEQLNLNQNSTLTTIETNSSSTLAEIVQQNAAVATNTNKLTTLTSDNPQQHQGHKFPKISFSDNSSSIIQCISNDRATFFVKIDFEENESDITPLRFEWSRGDVPIKNSDRFRITQTSNAVQLAIEHVTTEDAGHYTLCARTKGNDVIRKDVELVIEDKSTGDDPPIFLRRLVDLSVKVGTRTRLLVEIRSSTDVKLTWYRKYRRICENDRVKEINEGSFHYLEISPVILEDGGQWMVHAENLNGRNSCICHLNILVPKAYKVPEFIEELKAVLTQQGTVALECKVVGVPTPQLRWFKDSKEIKAGDIFALTANADDPTSLGTYTCEAVNCMGKTYSSSKVHVVGRGSREDSLKSADSLPSAGPPPIFTSELRDTSVKIGDTLILGCQVVVPPWPKNVVWYNKNGRVDIDERYKLIEDGLGVYMAEVKPSASCDEGEWKCVVTNDDGAVGISTCLVNMEIPKNYRKPRFMETLRAVLTDEGLVSFECKVVGFPAPILKWFKDGQELKPGDVYQLTGTNSLGTYCCIAKNCMGETSSMAVLTIEDIQNQLSEEERLVFANKNQPPKFLLGLKSQEAKINEAFQFTVKIEATPDPLLTWFRDELPIQSNERYNHYRGDRQYWHLDVRCLEIVDQAEWKCVVVNDFGTSVTSCFLKLQVPRHYKKPRFLECLRAVLTEEGAVNLECKVIGVPQPVLKWYKDGVELKPGDIHKIISGQDGTCCLGTYTCEARNCMGVMASSASLLGFEDDYSKQDCGKQHELQRNFSLSTIQEERTSQLYETPAGDITITERGDVSFSLEGKEVSVSLYETPDLTEEEALKIVEMYADQLSEHVTEQNIVELPPLRFVKETAQSGKLLMEATVIDISPEYFTHEEDLRTEAGMSDISINELTVHGFSAQELNNLDRETEDYAKKSFEKMEEELSLTTPDRKRKKSKATETEEFFSLSKATMSPNQNHEDEEADDSSELQTFASARMELGKEDVGEQPLKKKSRKSDSDSSKTNETETKLIDISGAVGDGLMVLPDKLAKKVITNEQEIADNVRRLLPLAKMLKILDAHMCAVEAEVISQSVMMMTASSADQSIAIIKNIGEPLQQIQSKLKVYSGETPIESLFETMKEDIRCLHIGLQVVEKCVEIDERGTTLIQRTSVCIIDSLADHIIKTLDELKTIANSFEGDSLKSHLLLTTDDIRQGLEITKGTIKSQALLQEAQELEANKHFTEAVAKLQELPEPLPFEKVPQVDLPPQAESVKLICQPVWEIQQALEKVENELSLEETDDGIYCKVHQKIVDNFLEPFQHLQQVLQVIEQRAETLTGTEQKINLAILDIVTPPLFELKKGLEVINAQPSNDVEGGKLTVNTVESMVPPLQEIQNGLAQLSQDVLTGGQVTEDLALDSEEVNKLLQSLAQAVLHLESNIEQIPCKIPQQIPVKLLTLKEHISTLIEQIVTQGVNKFHIILLGNIKRPIDELNYCMRQIEQKSITGSLGDLVDPLRSLDAKIKQSKDILCILPVNARDDLLGILHDVQQLLKTIEIDIDEYEFRMQQKEIESERQESDADQLQETMEWRFVQEKYSKQLQKLTKIIREVSKLEFIDNKLRAAFNDLIPPCGKIIVELRNMPDCQVFAQNIVRRTADSIQKINACLLQLGETTNKSQCNNLLNSVVRNYFQELKLAIDQSEDQTATVQTLQLAEAFNNMLNIVENIVQLCGEDAIDDLSTLEDVSALKSNAESLPVENSVTWKTATLEERRVQAEQLLGQLKQDIGTVLAHCSEFDLGCVQTETMQEVKAAVEKIHDFKECLQNTLSMNVMEYSPTGSDLRTMAEAVYSLESCALQIHEHLEQGIVTDTSDLEVNELRTIAEPLQELVHAVKVFYTQEFDQVSSIGTLTQISMTSASVMQSLKPFVLSVHENHAIETLESIANQISLTHLKQFVQPLRELEKALIMQEDNTCLSQIVALPEQKQQDLRAWAKPLLCLKGSIVQVKEELALSTLEECPEFKVIAQKSPVLFNLLKYCETMNADFLEQFEELSSENLSILKTYAEPQIVRSIDEKLIIKEMPQIEIFDMRKCVTESIQLLSKALLKTAAIQTAEVYELNLITERLRTDLQTLSKQKETESVEFIQLRNCLAKTMFKLKECLVHTYEADVEVAVEDIEKIFEDLLQVIPNLEKQLALEMKEKIALSCSEFITVIHRSEYESLLLLAEPIRNLLDSLTLLSDHNEVDIEKSSPLFQKIQMQLVRIVQIINNGDCLIEFCQDLKPALLNLANNLNSIKDFLEKNDGNIRVIELLQELDYFATDLKEVSCSLENNNRKNYLIQETSATKSFLMALEQGLTENNPLVHIFLEKHYEDVQQLEAALKTVECDIIPRVERSQMIWLAEELESIEAIGKLLDNLQENMKTLSQELVELPKDKAVFTAEVAEEISETKRQPLPEAERQDTVEFIKIPIVEECVNFIFKALKEDKHLQTLEADMQEALSSKDDNRRTESIFRIREHIVHTYDSSVNKHLENLIDSLLECNPNLLELINARYCLVIKENIESLQADIKALANEPCQSKLCSVHEKLLSLAEISDRLKPYRDIENSSQKIVELQKYLMEIFCTFDDLLEISDDDLTPAIEIVKALALRQYDENEKSKAGIKTAKVFEDILHLCAELKVTVEKVKVKLADSASIRQIPEAAETKSKAAAPDLKAREIEEKQSEAMIKKIDKKETVAKPLRPEVSEIKAEKVEKKVIDSTVKTIEKKKIEEMQLKAEVSEVTAEKIEKQEVSVDAKKLEHMAVEATKIKGKVSEVKAEKIEEKQSEAVVKEVDKKEIEAKDLKAEISEIKAGRVEEKMMDSTVKTIEQKKIEEMKLKADVPVFTPEKIKEEEVSVEIEEVEATKSMAKVSGVKAEKLEEKQSEAIMKKIDIKETEAKELKAEVSEIAAEKVEKKVIDSAVKTIEQKKIEEMKLKAEVSEVTPEKIEKQEVSVDVKKVRHMAVEATEVKGKATEVKAEKIEEKQSEVVVKEVDKKEIKAKELNSEIKADKVEGKMSESTVKTFELENLKEMKLKAEVFEIVPEKNKEEGVSVEAKKVEHTRVEAINSEAKVRQVEEENIEEKQLEKVKGNKYKENKEMRNAKRPPRVDVKLTNRNSSVGSDIKLTCSILGNDLQILWFKENKRLENNSKYKILFMDGLSCLEIKSADCNDAAVYRCVANNRNGEVETSCLVTIYDVPTNKFGTPPIFTRNIRDVFNSDQHLLTIECKVTGRPKPKICWQKDSTLLLQDSNKYTYVEMEDDMQQLMIRNPTDSDTGLYTCYAESESGQMKISKFIDISDYRLKEKTLPSAKTEKLLATNAEQSQSNMNHILALKDQAKDAQFKLRLQTPMKSMKIAAGCKAQLMCSISGFIEDVYWLRDEERILKDGRHKIYNINNNLSLEIYEARTDDSGQYKCVIRNSRHTVECQCQLHVYDSTSGFLPASFSQPMTIHYDGERGELYLACHVHGRQNVTWLRDDHSILNNRYRIVEEAGGVSKLIIRNPIHTDCGSFSCYVETNESIESITKDVRISELKSLMSSSTEMVESGLMSDFKPAKEMITAASKKSLLNHLIKSKRKPLFNTLLHDRNVIEGSNLRLSCNLLCDDNTKVEWLKDMKPLLSEDKRFQTCFTVKGEVILEIFTTEESDSGQYVCRATNDYGEMSTQAYIRIYKPYVDALKPSVFAQSIRDNYSLNDNELVLDCRVRGKPRPEIQWMKGTDYIIPGEKYTQVNEDDGYTKIIVHNPTEKDSGLYACVARNEAGENKLTHHVEFVGRERFTLQKTHGFFHRDPNKPHLVCPLGDQTVHKGGTIAISAEFMQTQSPIDVQWLLNRQALSGHPNVKTFHDHGIYTLAIIDATPECEGTYTCKAQNAFGRIESHAHVDISQGATKEERPPLFLSRPENEMKIAVGDPFSISFRIAGDPKPKLSFLKGTKDITKSDRVSKEVSDDYTRFTVQKSQISDSGTYFVVARNDNGTDRLFVTIEVRPRARSETPTLPRWGQPLESFPDVSYFKDPPSAISTEPLLIDSGPTHISLSWGKPPSNNSAPVIAYRVDTWAAGHDGGAIWKELGLTPINSFDAFNLKPNVQYHFRVTPKNRYGWGPAVQTSSPLQVGGVECLPEFTKILPGQVKALLHGLFTLECVVHGSPRPDVIWYKDGLRLGLHADVDRVKTRKLGSSCCLIIKNVYESDSGRYTCEATNIKGRVATFARLQVVTDPKLYEADHQLKEIVYNSNNIGSAGDTLPIFTMRLRDRRVQVTYPVRLTCQVMGYPKPDISWFKDDRPLVSTRHCLITADYQFYTLELASTSLSDSGIYTCTAKNELGSVSCHCSLVVDKGIRAYISPEFCMHLDPIYIFQEGQEIRLTAKVEAYPAVGVAWHRNGVKLRPNRRLRVALDCSGFVELTITDATVSDGGMYSCLASNAVGKAESLCRVCIEPKEMDDVTKRQQVNSQSNVPVIRTSDMPYSEEPLFVVKPRSSEAYEGDTVIICCEVVGDPKPEVVWLRDFLNPEYYKDAPHFRRIGEGPEYRLEIPYAKLDFTGTYSIIATNCRGEAKAIISLQIYAKDILKQKSMEKGSIRHGNVETLPRFIRQLRPLRCCDGDAVTLEAHVEGLPEPVIIWEKDGRVIPSGKDFDITYDGIKATLSIPRVYPEDEGEYTCVAKNVIGRSLSSACIIVDVPEEKENMLQSQLSRPSGLLSATSTPLSTPRSTPNRSFSPQRRFSHRHSLSEFTATRSEEQILAAPKFLAIPHNRVVEEGESVRFQCAIHGHPQPWSTWDKDGMIVTPTARIAIKELDDLRFLEVDEVGYADAGLYRVTLENDYGRIEATARLDVITRSRYSRSSSSRSVRASSSRRNAYLHRRLMGPSTAIGGRMALAASFRGFSVPSCKFYHNGLELQKNDKTLTVFNDQEAKIIVDNVNEDMEGIYTCLIQGQQHELIATSTVVHFHRMTSSRIEIPEIIKPLPEMIKCKEGDTIDLSFQMNCQHPYTYIWTRKNKTWHGEAISESQDFNYIDHGNGVLCLRIYDAFAIDSGIYTCDVITSEGYKCSTCTALHIETVNTQSTLNDLIVLKSPLPVLARIDDNVTFCARVYPTTAAVTWFVSGYRIEDDGADEFTLESSEADGVRMLHINNVNLNHSGEVQLSVNQPGKSTTLTTTTTSSTSSSSSFSSTSAVAASTLKVYTSLAVLPRSSNFFDNHSGSTLVETQLTTTTSSSNNSKGDIIRQPPYVLEGPNDCTALIGGCVRLSAIFEGVPKPQIAWFKASRPIVETSNIIINTSARKSVLQISDIAADDSGKYIVQVMNEYGSDVAVASVAVEGPPEPPSGKPSISQGPDRVAIAWCGPPFDGGCMITGFIIEMQELNDVNKEDERNWQEIASVVDSLAYTVKNLKPGCTYRFRVRAENVHGRSEPSMASEPVQIFEKREERNEELQNPIYIKSGGEFKERFDIIEELGKGRFGVVYKVQEKEEPRRILAAKVIKCIKSRDRVKIQEEISIMKSLKHPKLLQLAASFESNREIVMVMEYITGGELFERVVADDFTLTERDCILFVRQVCEGVAYMHSQSIVHLDLKPENIMCKTRTCHQIKIIDFGLAQRLNASTPIRVLFGTPEFIPPEIISYEPIGFQTDMWSVGVICYVLLSGLSPFMGDSDVETFANITRADYDFDDEAFDCVSQQAKDFISNLLVHRKEDRWSAEECLESPWLKPGRYDENLATTKICTDKLKKFIIRRKWQQALHHPLLTQAVNKLNNLSLCQILPYQHARYAATTKAHATQRNTVRSPQEMCLLSG